MKAPLELQRKTTETVLSKHKTYIENITYDSLSQNRPLLNRPTTSLPVPPPPANNQLFEEFMVIGVPKSDLADVSRHEPVFLTPRILFSYPDRP